MAMASFKGLRRFIRKVGNFSKRHSETMLECLPLWVSPGARANSSPRGARYGCSRRFFGLLKRLNKGSPVCWFAHSLIGLAMSITAPSLIYRCPPSTLTWPRFSCIRPPSYSSTKPSLFFDPQAYTVRTGQVVNLNH